MNDIALIGIYTAVAVIAWRLGRLIDEVNMIKRTHREDFIEAVVKTVKKIYRDT